MAPQKIIGGLLIRVRGHAAVDPPLLCIKPLDTQATWQSYYLVLSAVDDEDADLAIHFAGVDS